VTNPTIKAIETVAYGRRFRSRLEARCAVFLTELGLSWEYESEGFDLPSGRYLPDFKVWDKTQYSGFYWIECKPTQPVVSHGINRNGETVEEWVAKEVQLARELSSTTKAGVLFFSGNSFDVIRKVRIKTVEWHKSEFAHWLVGRGLMQENKYDPDMLQRDSIYHRYRDFSWQIWDRRSVVDTEFFFPMNIRGMNALDALFPAWPTERAYCAANAALSARFEHGEVVL
jgi:hypothetical protein